MFKDLFKKCIDARQIVDQFPKISIDLTGKRQQRKDPLLCVFKKSKITFKHRMELSNTHFITPILVLWRIIDLMHSIEELKGVGENGFDRTLFARSGNNYYAVTSSALKQNPMEEMPAILNSFSIIQFSHVLRYCLYLALIRSTQFQFHVKPLT